VKLAPQSAAIVDSRAFVHFRKGELKEALADYDQALKLNSKESASLFMRGVVKHRLGDKGGGDADEAAALAIDPNAASEFADVAVTP
jgi:tetratricopeptide (TPR) repeat protein